MPKRKRSTVGERRKYDYRPKRKITASEKCNSLSETELGQHVYKHEAAYDCGSPTLSHETKDHVGNYDHLYAQRFKEMEKDVEYMRNYYCTPALSQIMTSEKCHIKSETDLEQPIYDCTKSEIDLEQPVFKHEEFYECGSPTVSQQIKYHVGNQAQELQFVHVGMQAQTTEMDSHNLYSQRFEEIEKDNSVGYRRKFDSGPKLNQIMMSENCYIKSETELEQSVFNHVETYDCRRKIVSQQTKDVGSQAKQIETKEMHTQTIEIDCDHLYAHRFEEMEADNYDYGFENICKTICVDDDDDDNVIGVGVEDLTVTVESQEFKKLASDIKECVSHRDFSVRETERDITLIKFYISEHVSVKCTVQFDNYFNCKVFVHRKPIEPSHSFWIDLPRHYNSLDSVIKLLDKLETMNVCCGNCDEEFQTLVPVGGVLTSNTDTAVLAYREGDFGAVTASGKKYSSTIRSSKCEMITKRKMKCVSCTNYGYALTKRIKRLENRETSERKFNRSSFKHKDMTRNELYKKLGEQKEENDELLLIISKLKRKYENGSHEDNESVQEQKDKKLNSFTVR